MPLFSKIALPLLSVFGFYATYGLAIRNGTFGLVEKAAENFQLPGSNFALRSTFTGIGPIDKQLRVLLSFFWPAVSGDCPDVSLRTLRFAGQAGAAWMVVMMEALRSGNQGNAISYVTAWGLLVQNATFAVTMPIYWLTHLFTSPTAENGPESESLSLPTADAVAIPFSILIGYVLPSFLQTIKAPTYISSDTQQLLMAVWQIFPIWCSINQSLFKRLYDSFEPPDTPRSRLLALRAVYATALGLCVVSQIGATTISTTASLFPSLLTPSAASALSIPRVFLLNQPLFSAHKVANLGEGVLTFLQMDEVTGCMASLIWAATMHWKAQKGPVTWKYWALLQAKIFGSIPLGGPFAPALLLLWERDETAFAGDGEGRAEGKKKL